MRRGSAADFLVQQRVARRPIDGVIAAQRHLAGQRARAGVQFEQAVQHIRALLRRRLDHPALTEVETNALHLAAGVDHRPLEERGAVGGAVGRSGEDLAVGKVLLSGAVDPVPAGHANAQVRALRRCDVQFADALEVFASLPAAVSQRPPGRQRVRPIQQPARQKNA